MTTTIKELQSEVDALKTILDAYMWWSGGILSALTLFIIMFGMFSLGYIRYEANRRAEETAECTSKSIAESAANKYIAENLPSIFAEWKGIGDEVSKDEGDAISEQPEEGLDDDRS